MSKYQPLYFKLSDTGGVDVSGVTATAGDVDEGKIFVDSSGAEVEGTSTYKSDYTSLHTLVTQTTAAESDVDYGKTYVKSDGTQGTGSSTYKSDYTSLHTLVGQTTATAEDVAQGKLFINSSGVQTTGTASGGSSDDLLHLVERRNLSNFTIPNNTEQIGTYAFYHAPISNITIPNTVGYYYSSCFQGCTNLNITSLPNRPPLIYIYESAFNGCTSITTMTFPQATARIEKYAFRNCTGLTTVTFLGTPSSELNSMAFTGCTNLTTIRVPWTQGAVSGAPWGATNATIIYGYIPT